MLKVAVKRALYPHFLRRFDAALVVGARNRAYWTHYEYPPERILEAPHCVDNAFFATRSTREAGTEKRRNLGIPATAKVVLTAGKLIPIKRQLDLVEAVSQIRCSGLETHLVIAGSGPLEEQLRKLSQDRNITTHFLGFCNQSEMPAIYASADMLALCSESETWGLVVNEALACGTPALVSDACGCAPDLHRLLGPDAVFRTGDISDLTTKLRNMLTSPIGKSVIAAASTYFDPDKTADRIADATLNVRRSLRKFQ
jgi:glycosyltransferase involved in cell wall biosynthesis